MHWNRNARSAEDIIAGDMKYWDLAGLAMSVCLESNVMIRCAQEEVAGSAERSLLQENIYLSVI